MSRWLYGMHDPGGEHLFGDRPGWIVHTVALSEVGQFDYSSWASRGFTNIVRLNWGYHPNGTIPMPTRWDDFVRRCADFVAKSPGANIFILGNEPNHRIEWPGDTPIAPEAYAALFNMVYAEIKRIKPRAQVGTAAVAPWNERDSGMDWLDYLRLMLDPIQECDFLAVHGYTHGTHPDLIFSTEKVKNWYWHFPVTYQTIQSFPSKFAHKPVHVTETDQGDDAWADTNSGWVKNAYRSVHEYNQTPGTQKISSLSLYRWQTHNNDRWHINDKPGVHADFRDAVSMGFPSMTTVPVAQDKTVTTVLPSVKKEDKEKPVSTPIQADIDPRLIKYGIKVFPVQTNTPDSTVWRLKKARFYNEQEAGGRHHVYVETVDEQGRGVANVPFTVIAGDKTFGRATNGRFGFDAANYDMYPNRNGYGIRVEGGDTVTGIGMGDFTADGGFNAGIHTATVLTFQRGKAEVNEPTPTPPVIVVEPPAKPPDPVPSRGALILPCAGVITQRWGENPQNYARFGIPGHNGLDLANAEGTPVVAPADGIVAYVDTDKDYGNYVRIYHPHLRLHTFMAHLLDYSVRYGQRVKQGQQVARLGSTGNSSGPHCHFEIRLGTESAYAQGTFGHGNGRVDPQTVMYFLG